MVLAISDTSTSCYRCIMSKVCIGRALSLALMWCCVVNSPATAQTVPPAITAIRAQLYYDETASFSENILARRDLELWNTIIGEGGAEHASNSTLITVEVSGRHVPVGALSVEVTAVDANGRLLGRHGSAVALYDGKTRFYAPLFLYDTGCSEITISARLVGEGVNSTTSTSVIPFHCGE